MVVDDDADDRMLIGDAFKECGFEDQLCYATNGIELVDYLGRTCRAADPDACPRPDLILLDLNMPGMNGKETLHEIKANPKFRDIPVVILTTSSAEDDIAKTYTVGASSFIVKPASFDGLIAIVMDLLRYWFQVVRLPGVRPHPPLKLIGHARP